jgi:hypothetical protein
MRLLLLPRLKRRICKKIVKIVSFKKCDYMVLVAGSEDATCLKVLRKIADSTKCRIIGIPSNRDDHYIARLISEISSDTLEGHIVYLGEGVYAAGIGGREPLANIASIRHEVGEHNVSKLIFISYYPPQGLCDRGELIGVHYGLYEVLNFMVEVKPLLNVFTCSCPGFLRVALEGCEGGFDVICLPIGGECYGYVELTDGAVKTAYVKCTHSILEGLG